MYTQNLLHAFFQKAIEFYLWVENSAKIQDKDVKSGKKFPFFLLFRSKTKTITDKIKAILTN